MSLKRIAARRFPDDRGWFAETWSERRFASLGIDCGFVQDNQSVSARAGTLRGFHFQRPPQAQAKLVRCVRGRILDCVIDLRRGSSTFATVLTVPLDAASGEQLFIPVGFGHAFLTLEPDTEVIYKVSAPYAPECEGGVAWDDPALAVDWPLVPGEMIVADRDRRWPPLLENDSPFAHDGLPFQVEDVGRD